MRRTGAGTLQLAVPLLPAPVNRLAPASAMARMHQPKALGAAARSALSASTAAAFAAGFHVVSLRCLIAAHGGTPYASHKQPDVA
jgi:hypothetical protein